MADQISIYDEVYFPSYPHPASHPAWLATIAHLRGLKSPDPASCRVLEIGCGSGGNLLPLAELLPGSFFVGLDLSEQQISIAREQAALCELTNIEFHAADVLAFPADFGPFDYIVCHGVYSWTSDNAREKILAICREHLAANGVVYLNYNTFPGWHVQGMLRDMLQFHAATSSDKQGRVDQARQMIRFLRETIGQQHFAAALVHRELDALERSSDEYLFHAYLNVVNQPFYLHQVVARAEQHGLQYLGDAEPASTWPTALAPETDGKVRALAQGPGSQHPSGVLTVDVRQQQYHDFVGFTMSRRSLFCRAEFELTQSPTPQSIDSLHLSVQLENLQFAESPLPRLSGVTRRGQSITVTEPRLAFTIRDLAALWPESQPVSWLEQSVAEKLQQTGLAVSSHDQWKQDVIRCIAAEIIEPSVLPCPCTRNVGERPTATRFARHQAKNQNFVTNLRHAALRLGAFERAVLELLDGQTDLPTLLERLIASGSHVTMESLCSCLKKLASHGMLLERT